MHSTRLLVAVSFLLALGRVPLNAAPGLKCEVGRPVTIAGKISSVVVREETHWSIWLNRMSTACPMSAVVVEAKPLPPPCRPGSRITATGNFDGSDTLRSSLALMKCEP